MSAKLCDLCIEGKKNPNNKPNNKNKQPSLPKSFYLDFGQREEYLASKVEIAPGTSPIIVVTAVSWM